MIDQNKVVELTKLAENGDSDKLSQAFAQIPAEDHLSFGRAIADQSKLDHAANASLPVVELTEVTDPKAGQVVEKLESVGARSFIHPMSWWSGETRNVVYAEPKPETPSWMSQIEKLNVKAWLMDALDKASKTGDSK